MKKYNFAIFCTFLWLLVVCLLFSVECHSVLDWIHDAQGIDLFAIFVYPVLLGLMSILTGFTWFKAITKNGGGISRNSAIILLSFVFAVFLMSKLIFNKICT